MSPSDYNYKRYRVSFDENNPEHQKIISYLDSVPGGRKRNNLLLNLLLAGFEQCNGRGLILKEKMQVDEENNTRLNAVQLKQISKKIDKLLWYFINEYKVELDKYPFEKESEESDFTDSKLASQGEQYSADAEKYYERHIDEKKVNEPEDVSDNVEITNTENVNDIVHDDNDIDDIGMIIPEGVAAFLNSL